MFHFIVKEELPKHKPWTILCDQDFNWDLQKGRILSCTGSKKMNLSANHHRATFDFKKIRYLHLRIPVSPGDPPQRKSIKSFLLWVPKLNALHELHVTAIIKHPSRSDQGNRWKNHSEIDQDILKSLGQLKLYQLSKEIFLTVEVPKEKASTLCVNVSDYCLRKNVQRSLLHLWSTEPKKKPVRRSIRLSQRRA